MQRRFPKVASTTPHHHFADPRVRAAAGDDKAVHRERDAGAGAVRPGVCEESEWSLIFDLWSLSESENIVD